MFYRKIDYLSSKNIFYMFNIPLIDYFSNLLIYSPCVRSKKLKNTTLRGAKQSHYVYDQCVEIANPFVPQDSNG